MVDVIYVLFDIVDDESNCVLYIFRGVCLCGNFCCGWGVISFYCDDSCWCWFDWCCCGGCDIVCGCGCCRNVDVGDWSFFVGV